MKEFPQYRLEHFYKLHFYEGGLTLSQVQKMFEFIDEDRSKEYELLALVHGIDIRSGSKDEKEESTLDKQQKNQSLPLFRDPDEYADLSQEEREELTKKMMGKHKKWVSGQSIVGSK